MNNTINNNNNNINPLTGEFYNVMHFYSGIQIAAVKGLIEFFRHLIVMFYLSQNRSEHCYDPDCWLSAWSIDSWKIVIIITKYRNHNRLSGIKNCFQILWYIVECWSSEEYIFLSNCMPIIRNCLMLRSRVVLLILHCSVPFFLLFKCCNKSKINQIEKTELCYFVYLAML